MKKCVNTFYVFNIIPSWNICQYQYILFMMPQKTKSDLPPLKNVNGPIGKNIAMIRKRQGLSQEQLAELIGITQVLVSKYEIGILQLSGEMVIRFAKALNVSADNILGIDLFDGKEASPSLKITRRLQKIEELPESDQKALLRTIDKFIR